MDKTEYDLSTVDGVKQWHTEHHSWSVKHGHSIKECTTCTLLSHITALEGEVEVLKEELERKQRSINMALHPSRRNH